MNNTPTIMAINGQAALIFPVGEGWDFKTFSATELAGAVSMQFEFRGLSRYSDRDSAEEAAVAHLRKITIPLANLNDNRGQV